MLNTGQEYNLIVSNSNENKRLDIFLAEKLKTSRSLMKKLILQGEVQVNKLSEKRPQYKVKTDDNINLVYTPEENTDLVATPQKIKVVWENDQILVVDKPVGVVVHPAAGHYTDTLANGIKYYLESKNEKPLSDRSGLVHRLDAETSGLIIFAKTAEALDYVSKQFSARKVEKVYITVVKGKFPRNLTSSKSLGRDKFNRQKFSSRTNKPRAAYTEFKLLTLDQDAKYSLVIAFPHTGRTHQIRVHLAEAGFPVVGDKKYRGEKATRLMLHAYTLKFSPEMGKYLDLKSELPEDFLAGLKNLNFNIVILKNELGKISAEK